MPRCVRDRLVRSSQVEVREMRVVLAIAFVVIGLGAAGAIWTSTAVHRPASSGHLYNRPANWTPPHHGTPAWAKVTAILVGAAGVAAGVTVAATGSAATGSAAPRNRAALGRA